jgi:hypothetical protein
MRLLQAAAALLFVLSVAGCATKPMAPTPVASAGPVYSVMPPMTTYGCDALISARMGKPC